MFILNTRKLLAEWKQNSPQPDIEDNSDCGSLEVLLVFCRTRETTFLQDIGESAVIYNK
jgi:hypothetical protein